MRVKQAKQSVDTAREITADKTIRNKGDRERRLKEKNDINTRRFIEERRQKAMMHDKEKEKLRQVHEHQMQQLTKDIKLVSVFLFYISLFVFYISLLFLKTPYFPFFLIFI